MYEKKRALLKKLENPNISNKEKFQIEFKLYKLYKKENRPEWGLIFFFGSVILFMLILILNM